MFVIASARADEGEGTERPHLEHWLPQAMRLPLGVLSPKAIREWLERSGSPELARLAQDETFAGRLEEVTERYPLHLHFLIEELTRLSRERKDVRPALMQSPRGFTAYVRKQLDALQGELQTCPALRRLLAVLSVILGPMPEKELMALTGLTVFDLPLPWGVARWLSIVVSTPSGTAYAFAYPHLANQFEIVLADKATEAREAVLGYCVRWREHPSPYALRHYAEHLWLGKRYEELFQLGADEEYGKAQVTAFSDDPGLALRTMKLALLAASQIDNAARMAQFLLLHARRSEETKKETPLDALRAGQLARALELADLHDAELSLLWYLLLMWELKDVGRIDEAQLTLSRVLQRSLPHFSMWESSWTVVFIAPVFELSEDAFRKLCKRLLMTDSDRLKLCRYLTSCGDLAAARVVLQCIDDERCRKDAPEGIAGTEPWFAGLYRATMDRDGALKLLACAEAHPPVFSEVYIDPRGRDEGDAWGSLFAIARSQAKEGGFQEAKTTLALALEAARQIASYDPLRVAQVARVQAEIGDSDAARTTFASVLKIRGQSDAEELQAQAHPKTAEYERFDSGLETSQSSSALVSLAKAQAEADDQEAARTTLARALKAAEHIVGVGTKARALTTIALAQADIKDRKSARITLSDAMRSAVKMASQLSWQETEHDQVLGTIAVAQAELGDISAFETARHIIDRDDLRPVLLTTVNAFMVAEPDPEKHRLVFHIIRELADRDAVASIVALAEAQAKAGEVETARITLARAFGAAERYADREELAEALIMIARGQADIGEYQAAQATLRRVFEVARRGFKLNRILANVGAMLVERGDSQAALQLADEIEEEESKAWLLALIARDQARASEWTAALKTTEMILANRVSHLPDIAEAFIASGDRQVWKDLLVPCAYSLRAARRMCSVIACAYPDQEVAVWNVRESLSEAGRLT